MDIWKTSLVAGQRFRTRVTESRKPDKRLDPSQGVLPAMSRNVTGCRWCDLDQYHGRSVRTSLGKEYMYKLRVLYTHMVYLNSKGDTHKAHVQIAYWKTFREIGKQGIVNCGSRASGLEKGRDNSGPQPRSSRFRRHRQEDEQPSDKEGLEFKEKRSLVSWLPQSAPRDQRSC